MRPRASTFVERLSCRCRLLLPILLACAQFHAQAASSACENPSRLYFSVVPEGGGQRDLNRFKPLLKHISMKTGKPVDTMRAHSYGMVIEGLLGGAVDLAMLGPASYVAARKIDEGIVPIAAFARNSGAFHPEAASYHSLLITAYKRNLKTKEDLRGKRLAMVDPNSTSGSLIPRRYYAKKVNLKFEDHFDEIVYTGNHPKSVMSVVEGKVDAAFVSSTHLNELVREGKIKAEDVRILWRSPPIPTDPIVLRSNLCEPLVAAIRAAILDASHPANQKVLKAFNATRFVPVRDKDYDIVRELAR